MNPLPPALEDFQSRLGHHFADPTHLRLALTHASAGADTNYERLEFLGDRVLGLVMAELLYDSFAEENEGDLARRHAALVSGAALARVAAKIDLGTALTLSQAERAAGGAQNENMLADAMESLIGAIYREAGLDPCKRVIAALWADMLHTMDRPPTDPKTALQEWAQGRGLPLPRYEVVARDGPDHAPVFTISVNVSGLTPATASGASRRAAEKEAAQILLNTIEGRS